MGIHVEFNCSNCGYKESVSGRPDIGMNITTETMTCYDCQKLVDVIVGSYKDDSSGKPYLAKTPKCCPICSKRHLRSWPQITLKDRILFFLHRKSFYEDEDEKEEEYYANASYPCPRCNSEMSKNDNGEYVFWD